MPTTAQFANPPADQRSSSQTTTTQESRRDPIRERLNFDVTRAILYCSRAKNPRLKYLLAVLATWANDKAQSYPRVENIARRADLSERTVHTMLKQLVELGELRIDYNASPLGTNIYTICCALPDYRPRPAERRVQKRGAETPHKVAPEVEQETLLQKGSPSPKRYSQERKKAAAAEKPPAAADARLSDSDKKRERVPGTKSGYRDQYRQDVERILSEQPLPPRVMHGLGEFVQTLRDRGAPIEAVREAVSTTMQRRARRPAPEPISSLRYFLPAVNLIMNPQPYTWSSPPVNGPPQHESVVEDYSTGYQPRPRDEYGRVIHSA